MTGVESRKCAKKSAAQRRRAIVSWRNVNHLPDCDVILRSPVWLPMSPSDVSSDFIHPRIIRLSETAPYNVYTVSHKNQALFILAITLSYLCKRVHAYVFIVSTYKLSQLAWREKLLGKIWIYLHWEWRFWEDFWNSNGEKVRYCVMSCQYFEISTVCLRQILEPLIFSLRIQAKSNSDSKITTRI